MVRSRRGAMLFRFASAAALILVLAGCTPGGQFDPTVMFQNDMFDNKKKLQGERESVFPNGVPGTTTGVPPDLVKGYQPPPDQTADTSSAPGTTAPAAAAAEKPKPKPKPKPVVARVPSPTNQDPAFTQKPPTRISVGPKPTAPAPQEAAPSQAAPTQQTGTQSQSIWPAPPPAGSAQQSQQQSQSIWPNPPAPAKTSQ
jgi:hypothetical protein